MIQREERWANRGVEGRASQPIRQPGREAMVMAAAMIGVLMLGLQLWLLTVALDMFLSANQNELWVLSAGSGIVFLGGAVAFWMLLGRRSLRRRKR